MDGYVEEANGGDCDDSNADISPGATEECNEIDDDCDGLIDDEDDSVTGQQAFYSDTDGDGFGDAATETMMCVATDGLISDNTDCDDTDEMTYPGAAELDSETDCMNDADDDGFGAITDSTTVTSGTDCDDTNNVVNPGATEICN